MKRESGILLSIASLPSRYGIGCFSKEAYEFVDRLKEAGQSYWQILPLGPTSYGDSPYQSFSTFAPRHDRRCRGIHQTRNRRSARSDRQTVPADVQNRHRFRQKCLTTTKIGI